VTDWRKDPVPMATLESAALQRPVPSRRITALPTYVFAWLDERKAEARARGADLLDLGIGNPDRPTPAAVVEAMRAAVADPANHGYPPFRGTPAFRASAAAYMRRRFGVTVDAESQVLCLSGAKEGIAQLTLAYADADAVTLVPDVYYPVHGRATGMAGGELHAMHVGPENGWLPDFAAVPPDVARSARLMILNYPHNPTGATATPGFFEAAVAFCRRNGIVLVSDLAYAEIVFDGHRAPSVLQVPGAMEVAIELHSCSKSFNMAGSRIGFAVGAPDVVEALYAVRMNMGYGTPAFVQAGARVALDRAEELAPAVAESYRERRDVLLEGFRSLGWPADEPPHGTMFVWLPVPAGFTSQAWTEHLMDTTGVVVTPGNAFGPGGEGFFRLSLVAEPDVLRGAVERLRAKGIRYRA
jgi:LL-diaminopimelate aminotransferase